MKNCEICDDSMGNKRWGSQYLCAVCEVTEEMDNRKKKENWSVKSKKK